MMKTNLTLSRLLKDACSRACKEDALPSGVLRAMGNALLNGQEICAQHAVYGTIGLPFRGSSRAVVLSHVGTAKLSNFSFETRLELRCLPPHSTDCMAMGLVEKYASAAARHRNVHRRLLGVDDVCLADFAAYFEPVRKDDFDNEDFNEDQEHDEQLEDEGEQQPIEELSIAEKRGFVGRPWQAQPASESTSFRPFQTGRRP